MPKLIISARLEMINGEDVYHDLAIETTKQELAENLDAVRRQVITGFRRVFQTGDLIKVSEGLLVNPRHVVQVHLQDMKVEEGS